MAVVEITGDGRELQALARLMRKESDGAALRKDLAANLRVAVEPGVSAVQGRLRSIPHTSAAEPSPAMGTYLAARVKPQVRFSGRKTGVAIRIAKTPRLRGFAFASRRLDRGSWRHPVFGHDVWVEQQSPIPGYFEDTLAEGRERYRAAVLEALSKMSRRLTARQFLRGHP